MAQQKPNSRFYKNYFRDIDVVHSLQTKPDDRDWLLSTPPDDIKQSDVVLYPVSYTHLTLPTILLV